MKVKTSDLLAADVHVMFEFRTTERTFKKISFLFYRAKERNPIPKIHLLPSLLFDTWGGLFFYIGFARRRLCLFVRWSFYNVGDVCTEII